MTPARTPHRASDDAGFTLVEMLVSLGVLAVVAVLVAQAFGGGGRALSTLETRTAQGEEVAWAQGELRQLVEALVPHAVFLGGEPSVAFTGSDQSAEWMALVRPPGHTARVEWVRVDRSPQGDLQVAVSGPDGPPLYGPPRPLLRGVQALRFSYFGTATRTAAPAWRASWSDAAAPPQAVRLELQMADGRRWWPAFVARPAAMIDDACTVDPQTGACRGRS